MIKIENLCKLYQTESVETSALNNVSLQVNEGEFLAIMGASGCGKSTLLNILGLLDSASSGSYEFDGFPVDNKRESQLADVRRDNIGFIFQSFNLIDELTVEDNICLPLMYRKISVADRKQRVQEIAEKLNISHRLGHYPQQLSGGQQQRVAIARAIVSKPKLILADEPTGNLDSKNGVEVMDILSKLNAEGTTIVMVTHSQEQGDIASRKIRLHDGQIVASH